ncbi:MAG: hypothetical protein WCD89_00855 [Anaerocolumna sp.]
MINDKNMKSSLNGHVREMVKYHFNKDTGTPYWIRLADKLGIDPIRDITCYEDLNILGLFKDEDLKTIPVEEFIPKARLDFEKYNPHVYETGGTSGIPKRVMDTAHQEDNAAWICEILKYHGFGQKGKWLNLFPSGPHAVSLLTYTIARKRGEIFYSLDIDPRWVKVLISKNRPDIMEMYMDHIMDQAINILKSQDITYLFITPKLLENLILKYDLNRFKIKGIVCGGTQITSDFYKFIKTEAFPGIDFCALYGNTLMGVAPQVPPEYLHKGALPWSIHYYSYFPHFLIDVVYKEDPAKIVDYGMEGRVKITVLNKDIFIPGLLERDVGKRVKPSVLFPWDGISDVGCYAPMESSIIEGVY